MTGQPPPGRELPPKVEAGPELTPYLRARLAQSVQDWYMGRRISKFPEDLRVYEHLLWLTRANVVIEIGAQYGGSAIWFRDRLRALAAAGVVREPCVISVDRDLALVGAQPDGVTFVEGDVCDPAVADRVEQLLPGDARCLVVEDSAHTFETTSGALNHFARFVPPGGFFVVEDAVVDDDALRIDETWPRGVAPAIREWLRTDAGRDFEVRRDVELYGVTSHPGGYLRRRTR